MAGIQAACSNALTCRAGFAYRCQHDHVRQATLFLIATKGRTRGSTSSVLCGSNEPVSPAPQRLSIVDSSFPVAAITALLGLEATEELELDLSRASGLNRSSLETALTVLCLQTRKLRRVACTKCPLRNTQELQEAVMAKLRSRGQEGVALTITR